MDKILKPERFMPDPTSPVVVKEWRFWHGMLNNYLDSIQEFILDNFFGEIVFIMIMHLKI